MKKLLISLICVVMLSVAYGAKADPIDDCIKCPGLEAIFALKYKWVMVA